MARIFSTASDSTPALSPEFYSASAGRAASPLPSRDFIDALNDAPSSPRVTSRSSRVVRMLAEMPAHLAKNAAVVIKLVKARYMPGSLAEIQVDAVPTRRQLFELLITVNTEHWKEVEDMLCDFFPQEQRVTTPQPPNKPLQCPDAPLRLSCSAARTPQVIDHSSRSLFGMLRSAVNSRPIFPSTV